MKIRAVFRSKEIFQDKNLANYIEPFKYLIDFSLSRLFDGLEIEIRVCGFKNEKMSIFGNFELNFQFERKIIWISWASIRSSRKILGTYPNFDYATRWCYMIVIPKNA